MKTALIGAGNMGEAILAGTHRKHQFVAVEPRKDRQAFLRRKYRCIFRPLDLAVGTADVIILAVKPQDFADVLAELAGVSLKGKLVISIAAGITTRYIEKGLKQPVRVVRAMPNLPALMGVGVTAIARGSRATSKDLGTAKQIFSAIGQTLIVKEKAMNAVTAVSGSGPAYVFLFVECLMKAARKLGFTDCEARELVYQTLSGSVRMLITSRDRAETLRLKVTSKGGTTQAATDVFMKKNIEKIFIAALKAAQGRARELSK